MLATCIHSEGVQWEYVVLPVAACWRKAISTFASDGFVFLAKGTFPWLLVLSVMDYLSSLGAMLVLFLS